MFIDAGTKLCANAKKQTPTETAQHEETQIKLQRNKPSGSTNEFA